MRLDPSIRSQSGRDAGTSRLFEPFGDEGPAGVYADHSGIHLPHVLELVWRVWRSGYDVAGGRLRRFISNPHLNSTLFHDPGLVVRVTVETRSAAGRAFIQNQRDACRSPGRALYATRGSLGFSQ